MAIFIVKFGAKAVLILESHNFIKQQNEDVDFQSFIYKDKIETLIGDFVIEISSNDTDENNKAKPSVFRKIQSLVDRFIDSSDTIIDLVFEHYVKYSVDQDWLKECNVPKNLRREQLGDFINSRTISVIHDSDGEEYFHSRVYLSPQWESEHGLYLKHDESGWIQADY